MGYWIDGYGIEKLMDRWSEGRMIGRSVKTKEEKYENYN